MAVYLSKMAATMVGPSGNFGQIRRRFAVYRIDLLL